MEWTKDVDVEVNGDKAEWSREPTGAHGEAVGIQTWRKWGDRHGRTQRRGHRWHGVGVGTRTLGI